MITYFYLESYSISSQKEVHSHSTKSHISSTSVYDSKLSSSQRRESSSETSFSRTGSIRGSSRLGIGSDEKPVFVRTITSLNLERKHYYCLIWTYNCKTNYVNQVKTNHNPKFVKLLALTGSDTI